MTTLQDEIESLEAILMEDVNVCRDSSGLPELIETTVTPVGDEAMQQSVCVTLQVIPTPKYPELESPEFKLLRPRGLDDDRLKAIKAACYAKLEESLGFPVVFDLIEVIRDHLSGDNLPSGICAVCLYGFCDGDEITRTDCFHYLHSYCLARHLNAMRRNYQDEYQNLPTWLQKTTEPFKPTCPVCRENIKNECDSLKCAMPPAELQNAQDFQLTKELREMQERLSKLYLQQKKNGGIIDVEAESSPIISIQARGNSNNSNNKIDSDNKSNTIEVYDVAGNAGALIGDNTTKSISKENEKHKHWNDSDNPSTSGIKTFAPIVQQTQRISTSNNNYQHHNRRHYRGGRRYNYRDRDRTRQDVKQTNQEDSSISSTTQSNGCRSKQNQAAQYNTTR